MKNLLNLIGLLVLLSITLKVSAQKPPIKLGDIHKDQIEMQEYDLDPSADAFVLCDYGYLTFNYNLNEGQWENQLKRICRIKIFNDDGYKWATEQILLYDDNKVEQSISQIKGFTYNIENGNIQKTKLGKDDIFTEKTSENYKRVKFTLPKVKEGSVIEFSYTINSNYLSILDKWQFQKSIPVKWSEYIVCIPEYLTYLKNSQGYAAFHKFEIGSRPRTISWTESQRAEASLNGRSTAGGHSSHKIEYKDNIYHWIAKDMQGIKDEKFVGNYRNYLLSVDFQLSTYQTFSKEYHNVLSDWKEVIDKFLNTYDNFGPNMKKKSFYKDITSKILAEYTDPIQRTAAVYDFVSKHMKWNEKERIIPGQSIKKSFDDRTGSCADINALLVSMLRAVDITADPVIMSTIDNGLVHPVSPLLDKYNYLIVRATIDNNTVLLDATEKGLPFGMLPYRCLNQRGYAISKSSPGWVDLNPKIGIDKTSFCMLSIDSDGKIEGNVNYKNSGYSAVNVRNKIKNDGEEKYIEKFKGSHTNWSIGTFEIDVPESVNKPVKEKIVFEATGAAEAMGNMIYINPIFSGKIDENPFKQDERLLPIEFLMPMKNNYMLNLTIPEGYIIDELPQAVNIVTPDRTASLKYNVQIMGNKLQLSHSWQIKKSFYAADKFDDLKEFYSMLVSKHNEQIVLKKVESN